MRRVGFWRRRAVAAVAALLVVGGVGVRGGEAAFPGENGRIVFASDRRTADNREGDSEIYSAKADGTDLRQLTDNAADDVQPAWSAKGDRIAFARLIPGDTRPRYDIFTMAADGSRQRNVSDDPTADDQGPAWSPDGRRIAFAKRTNPFSPCADIYVMSATGGNQNNLTNGDPCNNGAPAWSPDGRRIAWSGQNGSALDIFVMGDDGGNRTNLTPGGPEQIAASPNWSPNGKQLVFVSQPEDIDVESAIVSIRDNGGGRRALTPIKNGTTDGSPVWSPDGRQIMFVRGAGRDDGELFVMQSNGAGETPVGGTAGRYPTFELDWQAR